MAKTIKGYALIGRIADVIPSNMKGQLAVFGTKCEAEQENGGAYDIEQVEIILVNKENE